MLVFLKHIVTQKLSRHINKYIDIMYNKYSSNQQHTKVINYILLVNFVGIFYQLIIKHKKYIICNYKYICFQNICTYNN